MKTSFDKKTSFHRRNSYNNYKQPRRVKERKQRIEKENCLFRRQNYVLTTLYKIISTNPLEVPKKKI